MTTNSVSGSFRGIEISFIYNGPHVVMSVFNTTNDSKRLRVMFQQQPRSGRVNWTTFQLTGQIQEVVVPPEVMHSLKLAFYVDNYEPIATYTDKILEELKRIQERSELENPTDVSVPDFDQQTPLLAKDGQIDTLLNHPDAEIDPTDSQEENGNNSSIDGKSDATNFQSIPDDTDEVQSVAKEDDVELNEMGEESSDTTLATSNINPETNSVEAQSKTSDELINGATADVSTSEKNKVDRAAKHVPDVDTELQFKIKVPSLPKSAATKPTTFIPPQTDSVRATKKPKQGFLGNLADVFGLSFANKKQFYMQQNKHLHDKFHADLEKMENDYNNGNGIPLETWDIDTLNEQQTAVLLLNLMVNEISEWRRETKKASPTKDTLAASLEEIEKELKQILKHTRGINAPSPTLFPDRNATSDQDLEHIQKDCDSYLKRFSEKLSVLEQKHAEKVRVPAFKKFLLEFVRDRLFPTIAEFTSLKPVQSRLSWFLDLVDYELMPIEPGITKFSPELHELKDVISSDLDTDTIVEVVTPGLQLKGGERVVQNALVVQAE